MPFECTLKLWKAVGGFQLTALHQVSQALWPAQKTLKCKTWWEESFEWRRNFTVKIVYKTQILPCFNVLCLELSLPLMHEVKKHLQSTSLLMALNLREFTPSRMLQGTKYSLSCHPGKHIPIFSTVIYTHVHFIDNITTNIMKKTKL